MGTVLDVAGLAGGLQAGGIAKMEAETAAKAEEAAGVAREADRKESLISALASQNASAGAGGIAAFEGSPLTIMNEDVRREQEATTRDKFNTTMRAKTLRAKGRIAQAQLGAEAVLKFASATEDKAAKAATGGAGGG